MVETSFYRSLKKELKEGTYNAIGAWEKDAETEQAEQRPTDHPEDTESSLKAKYTTRG